MINIILLFGVALALGFLLGKVTHWLKVTAIIGYIIAGIILGPLLGLVKTTEISGTIDLVVSITLGFVAFIIGGHFVLGTLKKLGKPMVIILFGEVFLTFILVSLCVYLLLKNLSIALLLGGVAPASAPAGTIATLRDCKAKGTLSTLSAAIVGLDDGLTILLFAFVLAYIKFSIGGVFSVASVVLIPLIEIFGGIALGIALGVCLSLAYKYIKGREETFTITIAFVLVCAGLAKFLHFSLILACLTLGSIFINLSPSLAKTSYETLENVITPLYIAFFALAGLLLRIDLLLVIGLLGVIYMVCRVTGLVGGAMVSSRAAKLEPKIQKYLGFTILSQAGVAIGLVCLATTELGAYPGGRELGTLAITIVAASTVIFEIIGPIGVRFAVTRAGESGKE